MIAPVLVGEQCVLSGLEERDAPAWHAGEDAEQLRWFDLRPAELADVRAAIARWRAGWADDGPLRQWGIRWREQLAGGVELRVHAGRWANISYVVFPTFRRRGLATEATILATEWALANLPVDEVAGLVDADNQASRGVLMAAGFTDLGWAAPADYGESGPLRRYVRRP